MTIDFKIEDADALGFDPARLAAIPDFLKAILHGKKCPGSVCWSRATAKLPPVTARAQCL